MYSETCVNGHLYSETTCIKRPLCDVPKVSAPYILTCIQKPPLYKGHYEVALAWPFNTGFTVILFKYFKVLNLVCTTKFLKYKSLENFQLYGTHGPLSQEIYAGFHLGGGGGGERGRLPPPPPWIFCAPPWKS